VESARWHKRRDESDQVFSSSAHFVSSTKARLALREAKSQSAVWESVSEEQKSLGASLGVSAHAAESPTSLHLSYDTDAVTGALRDYTDSLQAALPEDARGVVWAINGRLSHADVYGNPALFRKVWGKLLKGAALEAISLSRGKLVNAPSQPDEIIAWLESAGAAPAEAESLPPRTRLETRRARSQVRFDTHDTASPETVHVSVLAQ
jgi:hypothetical protein